MSRPRVRHGIPGQRRAFHVELGPRRRLRKAVQAHRELPGCRPIAASPRLEPQLAARAGRREVHDGVNPVRAKQPEHQVSIADIARDKRQAVPRSGLEQVHRLGVPAKEIVQGHHGVPIAEQSMHRVRSDVSRAAGYQNNHERS